MKYKIRKLYYKVRNTRDETVCRWTRHCAVCDLRKFCKAFNRQFARIMKTYPLDLYEKGVYSKILEQSLESYCDRQKSCNKCLGKCMCDTLVELGIELDRRD